MEEILDLYEQSLPAGEVLVCADERPYQLVADVRCGEGVALGRVARRDYTYVLKGVCNLFVVLAPRLGWRQVLVTERRTKRDWGRLLAWLAEEAFADARRIHLVCDNLSTHTLGALYLVLPAARARRCAQRFWVHPAPKHGSWLNMAEIEISALERQCLDRRIGERAELCAEVAAWVRSRNEAQVTVQWRFTSRDARKKLGRLYPKIIT